MVEQSLFSKFVGKLQVEVSGETLELDMKLKDKQKLMAAMAIYNDRPDEALEKIGEIYKNILKNSYPNEPEDNIDAFLTMKFEDFMAAISIALGWTTKEKLDKEMEDRAKKLTNLSNVD